MKSNLSKSMPMVLLLIILSSFFSPLTAHATEGRDFWSDFDVSITEGDDAGVSVGEDNDGKQGFGALISSLKNFIVGIAGVATVIAVGFFIFNFMKLGGSNSRTRSEAISGLIYSGVATAGLGSVTLIAAMFYGMIGSGSAE